MIARTLVLALSLALPSASLPAAAPPQEGLSSLVGSEVAAASQKDLPALWKRALELRDAAQLGEKGELDRALDEWLARRKELSPQATVLVAAGRLLGDAPDALRLSEALAPLIDGADPVMANAAAQLVSGDSFKALAPSRRDELANKMLQRAEDAALPPPLRLDFAKAAYRTGGGRERIKANKILRTFLESQDPELKAGGALAMAELGAAALEGELRATLERLARVPDERGKLAASYLEGEEWRRQRERDKEKLLGQLDSAGLPLEVRELLLVLRMIKERHLEGKTVAQEKLFEAAIDGMLGYMDEHSGLLTSDQYARFYGELEAEYGGIGAYVNEDPEDKLFTIVRPIYSGPAYRKGLMTDDKVVRIGNWETLNKPVDEIIKNLKGKPGTPVDLYVWRHGMDPGLIQRPSEDMKVTVTREAVRIPPGCYQMLPGGIGLIELDTFSQVAMDEIRRWIPELLGLGMQALILDLRYNGGGLLTEAREVAELFLAGDKDVVFTEGPDPANSERRRKEVLKTDRDATPVLPEALPLVILTGGGTASAAEIVSGALQDHQRATLVGKTTFGKGSVQTLIPVMEKELQDVWDDENENQMYDSWEKLLVDRDEDGEMDYAPRAKLTIARYLLPSGRSIHREIDREGHVTKEGGVTPDILIDAPPVEGWRIQEQRRIRAAVKEHVDDTYAANRELYGRLAVNDRKRPELYPGFEQLMAGLDTQLGPEDVRRVLRFEVRRRVQDDRGAEFPAGDFVEDVQVQKAIEVALEKLGRKPGEVSDYDLVFDLPRETAPGELTLAQHDAQELNRALGLLRASRTRGETLTSAEVDELIDLLGTIADY